MARKRSTSKPTIRINDHGHVSYPGGRPPARLQPPSNPNEYHYLTTRETEQRNQAFLGDVAARSQIDPNRPFPYPDKPPRSTRVAASIDRKARFVARGWPIYLSLAAIGIGVPIANNLMPGDNHGYQVVSGFSFAKQGEAGLGEGGTGNAPKPGEVYPNAENTSITIPANRTEPINVEVYDGTYEDADGQVIYDPIVVRGDDGHLRVARFDQSGNDSISLSLPYGEQQGTWRTPSGTVDESHYSAMQATAIPKILSTTTSSDPFHPHDQLYLVNPEHIPDAVVGHKAEPGIFSQPLPPMGQ